MNVQEQIKRVRAERSLALYASHISDALEKHMAEHPPGSLGLPKLLDERRCFWGIPADAFMRQPAYERVYVYQVPWTVDTHGADSKIAIPDDWKAAVNAQYPRGVIVGAGLKAMDVLVTNGMALGHIVTFQRMAPFRVPIGKIAGKEFELISQQVGDILDSEDTMAAMREGKVEIRWDAEAAKHYYYDVKSGKRFDPQEAWVGGGY